MFRTGLRSLRRGCYQICCENPSTRFSMAPLPSAETLILLPELGPRHARGAAHKNIGMILAFLVLNAIGIGDMAGQPARGECLLDVLTRLSKDDQSRWRRRGISAQPRRIGPADRRREVVGGTKNLRRDSPGPR